MKTKAVLFPTVFAILMAISSLGIPIPNTNIGTPWLTAAHTQTMPDGQQVNVDNVAFFLWGHQYTVVGKIIQSSFVGYDWRDFPFYSMLAAIIAIITGILAVMASRRVTTVIKGKEVRMGININPLNLLAASTILVAFAGLYLYYSANATVIPMLEANNYVVQYSYGLQFMAVSTVGFAVSTVMTYLNSLAEKKERLNASASSE